MPHMSFNTYAWNIVGNAGKCAGRTIVASAALGSPLIGGFLVNQTGTAYGLTAAQTEMCALLGAAIVPPAASGLTYGLARLEIFARAKFNRKADLAPIKRLEQSLKKSRGFYSFTTAAGLAWFVGELTFYILKSAFHGSALAPGIPLAACGALYGTGNLATTLLSNHFNAVIDRSLAQLPNRPAPAQPVTAHSPAAPARS